MCGICGFTGFNAPGLIESMVKSLHHRGPDNHNTFQDELMVLGHTRLSIVDLSESGNQPMKNEDGSLVLVANGEIYNHLEIRQKLEVAGHIFRSQSDCEVLLHAYEEYGLDSLKLYNAMFAFALWDRRRHRLILARDRLGIKPLYYYWDGEKLVFASEIKAILQYQGINRQINEHALIEYLSYENIYLNKTLFRDIHLLEPGTYVCLENGRLTHGQYWDVTFQENAARSIDDCLDEFRQISRQGVQNHLMSDVPVASYLSGGFDSTMVATYASELMDQPINTFTGRFGEGAKYDESACAQKVADNIGANHHVLTITDQDFLDHIQNIIYYMDEPRVGMGSFSQYMVARAAAQSYKVILTGHAGDELFAGYPAHKAMYVKDKLKKGAAGVSAMASLKPSEWPFFLYYTFFGAFSKSARYGFPVLFSSSDLKNALTPKWRDTFQGLSPTYALDQITKDTSWDALHRLQYHYMKTYLPALFVVEDKIGMAHSLESRTPLCDNGLVDFALTVPFDQKLYEGKLKYIIKEGMRDRLPDLLYHQRKKGFPTPLSKWFSKSLKPFLQNLLLDERTADRGIFNQDYVKNLLTQHFAMQRETPFTEQRAHKIWMMVNIELWARMYLDQVPAKDNMGKPDQIQIAENAG